MTDPDLSTRTVAFLATDGVEQVELTGPWEAVKATGATVHLISNVDEVRGYNHLDPGDTFPVDRPIHEQPGMGVHDHGGTPGGVEPRHLAVGAPGRHLPVDLGESRRDRRAHRPCIRPGRKQRLPCGAKGSASDRLGGARAPGQRPGNRPGGQRQNRASVWQAKILCHRSTSRNHRRKSTGPRLPAGPAWRALPRSSQAVRTGSIRNPRAQDGPTFRPTAYHG